MGSPQQNNINLKAVSGPDSLSRIDPTKVGRERFIHSCGNNRASAINATR